MVTVDWENVIRENRDDVHDYYTVSLITMCEQNDNKNNGGPQGVASVMDSAVYKDTLLCIWQHCARLPSTMFKKVFVSITGCDSVVLIFKVSTTGPTYTLQHFQSACKDCFHREQNSFFKRNGKTFSF